jgi:hypothetical protein
MIFAKQFDQITKADIDELVSSKAPACLAPEDGHRLDSD